MKFLHLLLFPLYNSFCTSVVGDVVMMAVVEHLGEGCVCRKNIIGDEL